MLTHADPKPGSFDTSPNGPNIAYARMRRWLGIAYVGAIVTACSTILTMGLASKLFSTVSQNNSSLLVPVAYAILFFSLCSLPFDITGFNIERLYGRTRMSLPSFLIKQIFATIKHGVILLTVASIISWVWSVSGLPGLLFTSVLLTLVLITGQPLFAKFYGGVSYDFSPLPVANSNSATMKSVPVMLAHCDERCFSGGIVGLPGLEKIVMPKWWITELSPSQFSSELARRNLIIASGGRFRGVVMAIVFTCLGNFMAAYVTTGYYSLAINSVAGLVTMSALFTLWSFLGLLTLPYFSHLGVYEADRLAVENGTDKEILLETIAKIDGYLEDEKERTMATDFIFHPVPNTKYRALALEQFPKKRRQGAWHAARYTVFLSIIGLGLLGRAVHCNAGKPELWAMLPAD